MATSISYKDSVYSGNLGMTNRFKDGIHGVTAVTFFQNIDAADGGKVRLLGGQAPSAYTASRGAAGMLNTLLLERCDVGATFAELVAVAEKHGLGKGGLKGNPVQRVIDHVRSFYLQADTRRAQTNGLRQAIAANGWNWQQIQRCAVLLDGKPWDGNALKRCVIDTTVILPVVLLAVNYKATPSLVKALNLPND